MKKNFIALASVVIALMMSACVKDVNTDIAPEGGVTRTIKATIEGMTRTSMNDFEAGSAAQVVWSSGDKIGVVTEDGTIRQATIDASSVGKAEAEFTVSGAVAGEKYIYAYYPYQSAVKYADNKLTGLRLNPKRKFIKNKTEEEGSLLNGYGLTFETNELPMTAKADADGNLEFKSACGVIELQLTDAKERNFFNFTIHSDEKELSDYGTIDLTAEQPAFVPYHMAAYNYNTIAAKQYGTHSAFMAGADNNGKGIKLLSDEPTKLFFVIPAGVYEDLQIQAATPALSVTKKATAAHEVKCSTILSFNAFDVNDIHNLYGEGEDVTNLSENGYSFTYLVPTSASPQKYKFVAKMVGDTKDFQLPDGTLINPNSSGKTSTNQNYNTTWVYAEDSEGVITNLRREGDNVYFTASKAGNAIIMIGTTGLERFNQFHIWVSDAKDQTLPGGHVFLNCNLGATYVPTSVAEATNMSQEQLWRSAGCLYQWGNPTPRPSRTSTMPPADFASTTIGDSNWTGAGSWILYPWAVDPYSIRLFSSTANASDLVRSRMYFNFYSCVTNTYADTGTLVWWQKDRTTYGDLRFGDVALWQSTKTQFDPCPVGYRVPSKQEIADAFTNEGTQTGKTCKIIPGAAGQYYTAGVGSEFVFVPWQGFRRATNTAAFNYAWANYPRAGFWYFDDTLTDEDDMVATYTGQNTYVYYYNNTTKKEEQNVSNAQFAKHSVYPACELRIGGTNWWVNNCNTENSVNAPAINNYRYPVNLGMGVRCVKIQ